MNNFVDFILDLRDDTLDFIENNRKKIIITAIIITILLLIITVLYMIFAPIKIYIVSANDQIGDVVGTKSQYVQLKTIAKKVGKTVDAGEFKWTTNDGLISLDEQGIVTWQLPMNEGTYSITASNGEISTTKYITKIGNELSALYKNSDYKIILQDTDGDGLTDLYEGSNSRTSQTEKDTDGDGLYDGDEIIMNLDPLKADSKSDGIKDGERKLEYTFENNGVTLSMTGMGNFTRTSVDKYPTETLDNVSYILDGVYLIYTEAKLNDAKITIKYDKEKVESKGLSENSLAIYKLNEDENTFTKIITDVDANNSTLSMTTNEFGKYFIADSSKLTSNLATELVFVIDNSGSMYSKEEYSNSEENDPEFKRVEVANNLIDKLQGNYKFGAGKFTFEYTELAKLTSDKEIVKNRIESIKTLPETFSGTYIGAGLQGGLGQFSGAEEKNRKYLILLSDGRDTNGNGYNGKLVEEQINVAIEKGVKVFSIGLGKSIDEKNLKRIAQDTKGKYYFAATYEDLKDVFSSISAQLNYNLYDTDGDTIDDSVILSDSEFLVGRNGFPFSNFSNTQVKYGYGYGMTLYAKMLYENNLPNELAYKKVVLSDGSSIEAPKVKFDRMVDTSLRTYVPDSLEVLINPPVNFWEKSVSNNILYINPLIKNQLQALGFGTFGVEYNNENAGFSKYESISLNVGPILRLDNKNVSTLEKKDTNLINILSRLDITKYRDEKFYFYDNNDTAFRLLSNKLKSGEPVMLRINDDYTVLAVKLLADKNNMNKYKIEVYDPNYSGIPKYIDVERYKFSDIAEISKVITDKYEYKFKYQGIDVGVCISSPNVQENE